MRGWLFKIALLVAGLIVGFVISYVATTFRVVEMSPFALNRAKHTEPFERVFVEMVRLGEAEAVLRGCGTGSGSLSRESHESFLEKEAELIKSLRLDVQSSRLAPPLDVVEAIVQVRRNDTGPQAGV